MDYRVNYEMEELLPVAGRLAEKYTGNESTSISYEKAEQLMEAVLYCIREAEEEKNSLTVAGEKVPAQQMYEAGLQAVERKVKAVLALYHKILPDFCDYGVRCLSDTFLKGIPQFFRWYDIRFAPQETILTLDYPVLRDLSGYTGVDKIYEFLVCMEQEQRFLRAFPENEVKDALFQYNAGYRDGLENICEIFRMER